MQHSRGAESGADELGAFLDEHPDVDAIDAIFPDLCGVLRGKRLTTSHARHLFDTGLQIPGSMLFLSVTGSCMDPLGKGVSDGDPDVLMRPIAGSLRQLPWADRRRAQVFVTLRGADGGDNPFDPRQILAGVQARFQGMGLQPVVACELEFCLIDAVADTRGMPQRPVSAATGRRHESLQLMSLAYMDDFEPFVEEVRSACRALSVPVTAVNAEYGGDQFEINLHHVGCALRAADDAVRLKQVVQGVAARHGMRATFMAKPYAWAAGSGMHWHVSLIDGQGANCFDENTPAGADRLRHAVAGVLRTMPESLAFAAPNINSFRRFQPGLFVPTTCSWGYNNRSVAVRVPAGASADRRLEYRLAGADANPYLVLAALLAGMHHGIDEQLPPPPPCEGSEARKENAALPRRQHEALALLRDAGILPHYLGREYCAVYAECKALETDAFLGEASAREFDWYLRPDA